MKKIIFSFIIMFFPFLVMADTLDVSTKEELKNALENSNSVNLINDIELDGLITINGDVKINGNGKKIIYNKDYFQGILSIPSGSSLNIENTIIDGNNDWKWINEDEDKLNYEKTTLSEILTIPRDTLNTHVISAAGNLTLNNVTIQHFFIQSEKGYVIYATNNSKVIFNNSLITECYGAVMKLVQSNLELNDGNIISNNYGYGNKGGIIQLDRSNAIMNNTEIIDNVAVARSGAIFGVVNTSMLTMNNGRIDNNYSKYHGSASTGSMITIESGGGFVMNGGSISNNVGTLASVISSRWTNTTDSGDKGIVFNKGTIKGNTTYKNTWLNASIFIRSSATIGEDMVIDGDVVVNNTSAILTNNGTINGNLTVNDSTGSAINNGTVNGTASLVAGSLTNKGVIKNASETVNEITNTGTIEEEYVKKLPEVDGKYIVTFDMMGGKENTKGYTMLDVYVDVNTPISKDNVTNITLYGHTFNGDWYTSKEFLTVYDFTKNVEGNITLYANNVPNEHIVSWKVDDTITKDTYHYGEIIVLPTPPKKEGFIFKEWQGYSEGMTLPDNDLTFIAVFEEVNNPDTSTQLINIICITIVLIMTIAAILILSVYSKKLY